MSIIDGLIKPTIDTTINTNIDMSSETNTNNVEKIEHHHHYYTPIILQINDAETAVAITKALINEVKKSGDILTPNS